MVWNGKQSKSLRHRSGQVETEDTALSSLTWRCGVGVSWGVAFCQGTTEVWADAGLLRSRGGAWVLKRTAPEYQWSLKGGPSFCPHQLRVLNTFSPEFGSPSVFL